MAVMIYRTVGLRGNQQENHLFGWVAHILRQIHRGNVAIDPWATRFDFCCLVGKHRVPQNVKDENPTNFDSRVWVLSLDPLDINMEGAQMIFLLVSL